MVFRFGNIRCGIRSSFENPTDLFDCRRDVTSLSFLLKKSYEPLTLRSVTLVISKYLLVNSDHSFFRDQLFTFESGKLTRVLRSTSQNLSDLKWSIGRTANRLLLRPTTLNHLVSAFLRKIVKQRNR